MTKVFVVTADAVTDTAGEVLDYGHVVGVRATLEEADALVKATVGTSYWHKEYDYTVDEFEI